VPCYLHEITKSQTDRSKRIGYKTKRMKKHRAKKKAIESKDEKEFRT
jgi:hypothetical protein